MAAGAWTFTNTARTKILDGTFDIADDSYKMALSQTGIRAAIEETA